MVLKMKKRNESSKSLIICTTPLQMVIAEKIIQNNQDERFDLITLVVNDNDKYKYYFNRIKHHCNRSLYYQLTGDLKGFVKFIKEIKNQKFNVSYTKVYLASIDSSYCQYMLSRSRSPEIFTFDDGTANIVPTSIYYSPISYSISKRLARKAFGIKYSMDDIKYNSVIHYTIYKDIPNITKKTKFLNLIDRTHLNNLSINHDVKKLNIYLGQPLDEITEYFTHKKLNEILETLNINYYFPHPRETSIPNGNFKVINSNLIFEDYIIQLIQNDISPIVNVFSFTSTAILNISNIRQVKVHYIYHPELEYKLKDLYSLAQISFNIPLIKVNKSKHLPLSLIE